MVRARGSTGRLDARPDFEDLLGLIHMLPIGILKFRIDGDIDLINPQARNTLLRTGGDGTLSNIYTALSAHVPDLCSLVLAFSGETGRIGDEMPLLVGLDRFGLTVHKIDELTYLAILRDLSELAQLNARLLQENEKLKRQKDDILAIEMHFSEALDRISQGVCMFDSQQRIIVASRRFREIYQLSEEQVKPGTTLRQILEQRQINGTHFGEDIHRYVLFNPTLESETNRLSDGRVIAIARHPCSDGGWVSTHEDITERNRIAERLAFLALNDDLTGLPNRVLMNDKLAEAIEMMQLNGRLFSLLLLDLDDFKRINDTLGHPLGDALLKAVADRLRTALYKGDILARLGGDEFGIIQTAQASRREEAIALVLRIEETLSRPFSLDGNTVNIGASFGITMALDSTMTAADLLKQADLALYRTKSEKRNCYSFFSPDLLAQADARRSLEVELHEAIKNREFELHYQAVFDAKTQEIVGAEALVRWRHPTRGLITPDKFIPLAEETGLIVPLGEWIIQKACADGATWPEHVKIAVNLSAVQFRKSNLLDVILCALAESDLDPRRLELEITESVLLGYEEDYVTTIRQLKKIGVSFALDDFGTGYSSLSYLTKYPFDKIKIDRSFTKGFGNQACCAAVVSSVIVLARGLNMVTTAEGVETEGQYELLREAGVDNLQGFLFARPVPATELCLARWQSSGLISPLLPRASKRSSSTFPNQLQIR